MSIGCPFWVGHSYSFLAFFSACNKCSKQCILLAWSLITRPLVISCLTRTKLRRLSALGPMRHSLGEHHDFRHFFVDKDTCNCHSILFLPTFSRPSSSAVPSSLCTDGLPKKMEVPRLQIVNPCLWNNVVDTHSATSDVITHSRRVDSWLTKI